MAVIYPYVSREWEYNRLRATPVDILLFKNNFTPDIDTLIGDFVECDFSGYSLNTVAFGTISRDGDDNASSTTETARFQHDGGATSNSVYGWYMLDHFSGTLLRAERFSDAPRAMVAIPDEIQVTVRTTQGGCP